MDFEDSRSLNTGAEAAVLFASYEPRCLTVARQLSEQEFAGDVFVFFCEDIHSDSVAKNLATIDRLLKNKCRRLPVSYHNPEPMLKAARPLGQRGSLVVDITCFNRENLFALLWSSRLGIEHRPALQIGYTAPEEYGSWLSRDYHTPHNLVGFGGAFDSGKERLLICLVGYEAKRALAVIETAEPSSVILALGGIPTQKEFTARNREAVLEVLGSDRFETCEIDVKNPHKTLKELSGLVEGIDMPDSSVNIAPFNTKLSCLATYALWLSKPSIRIWNALPETYNVRGYSKGETNPRYFDISWHTTVRRAKPGCRND